MNRFILNETSYHGAGAISAIPAEVKKRGLKKAFVCSDPDLVKFKVTDKGVEIKLVDRVRALETLCGLLEETDGGGAEALYQALEAVAPELEAGGDC